MEMVICERNESKNEKSVVGFYVKWTFGTEADLGTFQVTILGRRWLVSKNRQSIWIVLGEISHNVWIRNVLCENYLLFSMVFGIIVRGFFH